MLITIVTHCWAVEKPQYAVFLRCQLSSLLHYKSNTSVRVVVCAESADDATVAVLQDFAGTGLFLDVVWLKREEMWRRCIGRNIAARSDLRSDLIWFTDCDYLFLDGCLDSVMQQWADCGIPDLIWPTSYLANHDKRFVDAFVATAGGIRVPLLPYRDGSDFVVTPVKRAIGGLHIVSGTYARRHGYLHDTKWQRPPNRPYPDFRDDVKFRQALVSSGAPVVAVPSFPGLCRLRHTEVGYGRGDTASSVIS